MKNIGLTYEGYCALCKNISLKSELVAGREDYEDAAEGILYCIEMARKLGFNDEAARNYVCFVASYDVEEKTR